MTLPEMTVYPKRDQPAELCQQRGETHPQSGTVNRFCALFRAIAMYMMPPNELIL